MNAPLDLRADNAVRLGLPANLEAEQALLGAVLYDNGALEFVDGLEPRHFHEPFHGRLFEIAAGRIAAGKLAEPILLADEFKSDPAFEAIGGLVYLADLVDHAPPARTARDFADTIIDRALRRELTRIADEVKARADKGDGSGREQLEAAEGALFDLAERRADAGGIVNFENALDGALQMAAAAFARDGKLSGIPTGLIDLDQKLGGLHPSDLVILAGRPSMGKTALATNIAFNAARRYAFEAQPDGTRKTVAGGRVLFFSLEMSADQLGTRILAEISGISSDRIRKGHIDAAEFGRLRDARDEIRTSPLRIDATGGLSIQKLAARARREKRRNGLDLIVVDYLQLVTTSERLGNRTEAVSAITQALKALAKDLNVPVVALSQLSRQVENREDKRPQLADLRESGSIEQDADVVMFVYREAYYLSRAEPKAGTAEHLTWADEMSQVQGLAEVIIGKQRHGPIGTVRLAFNDSLTKFNNLARDGVDFLAGRLPYGADA